MSRCASDQEATERKFNTLKMQHTTGSHHLQQQPYQTPFLSQTKTHLNPLDTIYINLLLGRPP